ncbi:MAG: glycosyltransferase family 61 protein [Methylacidiphilales bacterium]|nr:glycosyltransferase family 61 protein [Candidatus Methylacidiphilales bacterium]
MFKRLFSTQGSLFPRIDNFLRTTRLLRSWRIDEAVYAEDLVGSSVTHLQTIVAAQDRVSLNVTPRDQQFLRVCKYYHEGEYSRDRIFCCEVPEALCHVATGLVCTKNFLGIKDSQMAYRMALRQGDVGNRLYRPFQWFKPLRVRRLPGVYATINNIYYKGWAHWLFDCLPRLYSLEKASAGERVVLLVPDDMGASWNESLECVLPRNFEIQRLPADSWVQVDRLLLASYATGRANSHMPGEFYEFVRKACFTQFGLPLENRPAERIYVSRANARHRRVLNEEPLVQLLARYGFRNVALEKLSFREQVELFHRAEIVVGADGSNWGDMLFAGKIKILVLYSDAQPNMHWFTAAKGLGQEHFFLTGNAPTAHLDFSVHLADLERMLTAEMGVAPMTPA